MQVVHHDLQWPPRVELLSKTQQTTWLLPPHNPFSCQCCDHQLCVSCTIGFQRCTITFTLSQSMFAAQIQPQPCCSKLLTSLYRCVIMIGFTFQPFIEQARNLVDTAWSRNQSKMNTLLSVELDDVICPRYVAWAAWVPGVVCQEYCCRPCPFWSGWPDCCWLTTCCSCSTWSTPPFSTSRTISTEVTRITTVKVSMFALSSGRSTFVSFVLSFKLPLLFPLPLPVLPPPLFPHLRPFPWPTATTETPKVVPPTCFTTFSFTCAFFTVACSSFSVPLPLV